MEDLSRAVSDIQVSLDSSRQRLTTLEKNARRSVSSEVSEARTALKASDSKLQHTALQMRSYLKQIEYVSNAETSVDLAPQMTWLQDSLQSIASSFVDARGAADRALTSTMAYQCSVLDVGQEVEQSREKLSQCQSEATVLANQATSALETSEYLLLDAKRQITQKEAEIAQKGAEAATKRRRKTELESQISQKEVEIANAQRLRQSKKEDAAIGVGLSIFGVLAAPFTGGASLALTAAGAGVAGYKLGRVSEIQDEISSIRSSVSNLNGQISQSVRDVANLEEEKRNLQSRITQYETEIATRKSKNAEYQQQINAAEDVKGEIDVLERHAQSATANVADDNRQLLKMKHALDKCNGEIRDKSLEVASEVTLIERMAGLLGTRIGNKVKRAREFRRQRQAMERVSQALEQLHSEVPLLLPGQQRKFLDVKPWNASETVVTELEDIPETAYFPER